MSGYYQDYEAYWKSVDRGLAIKIYKEYLEYMKSTMIDRVLRRL